MEFIWQSRQTTFLGMRDLPWDISDFEMKAFSTFYSSEREPIDAHRGYLRKLNLAPHIGFLRMRDRMPYIFRVAPVHLPRYLSEEFGVFTSHVALGPPVRFVRKPATSAFYLNRWLGNESVWLW